MAVRNLFARQKRTLAPSSAHTKVKEGDWTQTDSDASLYALLELLHELLRLDVVHA